MKQWIIHILDTIADELYGTPRHMTRQNIDSPYIDPETLSSLKSREGVAKMHKCEKCGAVLIRADLYDPKGIIPPLHERFYGGIYDGDGSWWICINPSCRDGKENVFCASLPVYC